MSDLLKGIRNLGFPKLPDPLFSCYEFSDESNSASASKNQPAGARVMNGNPAEGSPTEVNLGNGHLS